MKKLVALLVLAALCCALLNLTPEETVGRGSGLSDEGLARKREAVRCALALNRPDADDPLDALAKLGGFEIASMAGAFLGGGLFGGGLRGTRFGFFLLRFFATGGFDLFLLLRVYRLPQIAFQNSVFFAFTARLLLISSSRDALFTDISSLILEE